jgi:hypothetical protein
MNLGPGIALLIVGLVLAMRIFTFDFTWVDEYRLGVLLVLGGLVTIALSLVTSFRHSRSGRPDRPF